MSILRCAALALLCMLRVAAGHAGDAPTPPFAPGQMWSIKSAPPSPVKVVIGRVESWNGKVAVHVSLFDVPLPSGPPGGTMVRMGHLPFDQAALAGSVDRLLARGTAPAPEFEAGYAHWLATRGGIFISGVAETVTAIFDVRPARN